MKRLFILYCAVLMTAALFLPVANAQTGQEPSSTSKFYLATSLDLLDVEVEGAAAVDNVLVEYKDFYPDSANRFHFGFGNRLNENLAFEASVARFSAGRDVTHPELVWIRSNNPVRADTKYESTSILLSLIAERPINEPKTAKLYGQFGLDRYSDKETGKFIDAGAVLFEGTEKYSGTGIFLTAGVSFALNDKIALRVGYHLVESSHDLDGDDMNLGGLTIGVMTNF